MIWTYKGEIYVRGSRIWSSPLDRICGFLSERKRALKLCWCLQHREQKETISSLVNRQIIVSSPELLLYETDSWEDASLTTIILASSRPEWVNQYLYALPASSYCTKYSLSTILPWVALGWTKVTLHYHLYFRWGGVPEPSFRNY